MNEITTRDEFKKWVRIRMIDLDTNQAKIAEQLGIVAPRISDVMRGHPNGRKYLIPLITALGGDLEKFKNIIDDTLSKGA